METVKKIFSEYVWWKYVATALLAGVLVATAIYATPLRYTDLLEPTIRDVDPVAFYDDFKNNKDGYIFIDVRSASSYKANHAVGSINNPLHTLYDLRHVLPKKGKQIVLIFSGARASGVGFIYLQSYGFRNISRIEGGIEEWTAQGLPVEGAKGSITTES